MNMKNSKPVWKNSGKPQIKGKRNQKPNAPTEEAPKELTILMTPLPFRDWLLEQHPKTVLGNVYYGDRCPIAIFLSERGYGNPLIAATSVCIDKHSQTTERAIYELPQWVHDFYYFNRKNSTSSAFADYPEPMAEQCLKRLKIVMELCNELEEEEA